VSHSKTARTGSHNRATRIAQANRTASGERPVLNNQDRIEGLDSQDWTTRTGQPGQNRQYREAMTEQPEQENQGKPVRTGQSGQERKDRTAQNITNTTRRQEQDNHNRGIMMNMTAKKVREKDRKKQNN
jgi:hypothetical protein